MANANSTEIRAEVGDKLLCVFVSAENAEILGAFADALESEIPLSLYFRLKSVELYEKPLSAKKVAQNLENIFSVSEINAIKNPNDSRFCDIFSNPTNRATISSLRELAMPTEAIQKNNVDCHDSANAESRNDEFMRLDSPDSLKTALYNLCDDLAKGQSITLGTSKGAISLSIKSDDFDFILANDISTLSLYTRASTDELNALASFEKPLLSLNIKEVFAREVGAKNALFILPYDIILCCISSILLNCEIAFVYGKKINSANLNLVYDSTHKSDFFEIIVGQNGYFLKKDFLDLSTNPSGKNLSNLWDFLDFSFDDFKGESIKSNFTPHSPSLRGDLSPKQSTQNNDIFIAYLSTKNPTHLVNLRNKAQILTIAFDKNPKNILQKITTLENGDKLIANFKKAFEARYEAIQSLDSTPQWTQNIMDIFECAAMILGNERDKNAIFELAQSYLRDIGPKIDFKNTKSSLGVGNSPLELHSADFGIFGASQTPSLVSAPKIPKNYESQTENPSVVDSLHESNKKIKSKKPIKSFCYFWLSPKVESSLPLNSNLLVARSANLESRPIRGAKNRNQTSISASADFLLESEKRGSPPKSEKAAAFWRVGGAGRGVQPFLRKEKGESKSKEIVDDSRIAKIDSSPTAQNDESLDCFGDESPRNDGVESPKRELQTSDLIYDESRTIRSVISFTLAGSEPEVIAFGIIESLVDYLVLIFRDAQEKFGTKNMGIIGDIFANKIFFDKITQKIPKDFNLVFPKFLDYD